MASNFFKVNNGLTLGAQSAAPSNPVNGDIYYNSTLGKFQKYESGVWSNFGSGSGSGVNYVSNPDAEAGTAGWATYADAAGTSPVDGTGGSPASTLTATSSVPLRGTQSFLLTKSANNRQGEGVSYDFTIDQADEASILQIEFDYLPSSGYSGTNSDIQMFVYDKTNAVLIPVTPQTVIGGSLVPSTKYRGTFQTANNSNSYRLIFHISTTSATAYTFKFDNVSVGPQLQAIGNVITDWKAYTPIFQGFGTVTAVSFNSRRVGDTLEVIGTFAPGTTTAVQAQIGIGYNGGSGNVTVDVGNKISGVSLVGDAAVSQVGTTIFRWGIVGPSAASAFVNMAEQNSTTGLTVAANGNVVASTGNTVNINFRVPIVGWSSNVVVSSDTDTRVLAAVYTQTAGQTITNGGSQIVNYANSSTDTHGAVTTGASWKFTAPMAGLYNVEAAVAYQSAANVAGDSVQLILFKNGVSYATIWDEVFTTTTTCRRSARGSQLISLVAGDFIDIRTINTRAGGSTLLSTSAADNIVSVYRLCGPATIAASESVGMRYGGTSSAVTGSIAAVVLSTKEYDTHNAYSGSTYTVPIAGKYQVSAGVTFGGTFTVGQSATINIFKNGALHSQYLAVAMGTVGQIGSQVSDSISCLPGDTIQLQASSAATTPTLNSSAAVTYMSIVRVGN